MNILITGISGFVGQNLAPYLQEKGFTVTGVTRNPKSSNDVSYKFLSKEDWNHSLAMVHLAGKAHDLKKTANENEYFRINTELTKELYNQFLSSECSVFMYMSSVKAVADNVETILTEDVIPAPITAYGKSKLAAEQYLLTQKLPKGKFVYILRPCMIHGSGNKGNLNVLFSMANKSIPYPFGAFQNERSFLSVDNLSYIIKELIVQQPTSGSYNVADDAYLSSSNVYITMGEVLGKQLKVINFPKQMINVIGKVGDMLPITINSEKIQKLTENYRVSNAKIKTVLGIKKMPLTAKEGLIKTIQSFKNSK